MNNQQRVLEYINQYQADNGRMPTGKEVKSGLNLASSDVVFVYVSRLRKLGLIPDKLPKSKPVKKPKASIATKQKVLDYIKRYIATHGYPPSNNDITKDLNLSSKSVAFYYLNQLRKDGAIISDPKIARSIRIVQE